jgi:Na+/melibiose symporter-like transporter
MIFDWKSADPNSIGYYLIYFFILLMMYIIVMICSSLIKNKQNNINSRERNANGMVFSIENLTPEQSSLRFRYLLVSTAIRAAVWVKAPYIFALYNRLHGFTRGDIGILYAIDNCSSLIMGPILGGLGDIYGRKKFCFLYCAIVVSHITIRLTGSQSLAYFAQFLTGVSGALIETVFESWLNFEASLLFEHDHNGRMHKNLFLREIFSK